MAVRTKRGENIIWKREDGEDKWDDTALIEAYDLAVSRAKEAMALSKDPSSVPPKKDQSYKRKDKNPERKKWKIGDYCRAIFSEDGEMYEAVIKEISECGTQCIVQFIGYGNEEEVYIAEIEPSHGKVAREEQKEISGFGTEMQNGFDDESSIYSESQSSTGTVRTDRSEKRHSINSHTPKGRSRHSRTYNNVSQVESHYENDLSSVAMKNPMPPPPIPFPINQSVTDDEALASMLMSWYMAGYHTGFYQGRASAHESDSHRAHSHCYHYH